MLNLLSNKLNFLNDKNISKHHPQNNMTKTCQHKFYKFQDT